MKTTFLYTPIIQNITLCLLLIIICNACQSESDCLKSTGKITTETRKIKPFTTLSIRDNIQIELTEQPDSLITVEAGQNLIGKIKTENQGDILNITNENTCNWVRSYEPEIKVKIGIGVRQDFLEIRHYGYGKIFCQHILPVSYLVFNSFSSGGNADLQCNTLYASIYSNTQADLKISGKSQVFQTIMDGIGRVRGEELKADTCIVQHNGSNQVRVYPIKKLIANITRTGKIIYYHQPEQIIQNISPQGELVKK